MTDGREDYADNDLPPMFAPPPSTIFLLAALFAIVWLCGCCGVTFWYLPSLGPDN